MRVPITLLPVGGASAELTHAQAMQSPCLSCAESPCCSYLPVHKFTVSNLADLDYARWLLNFTGIELGIDHHGEWSVYFRQSCRHLSPTDRSCTLHGTAEQPIVCQQYDPYQCWYKRVMTVPASDELVRVDTRRFDWLLERVRYNEHRQVVASPSWHNIVAAFAEMPLDVTPVPHPPQPAHSAAESQARTTLPLRAISAGPRRYTDLASSNPCDGCASYCCTRVEFPLTIPRSVASLDFIKFSLGFPGVEIGITDDGWRLVIKTTCTHLRGNRCGVYGTPERPLKCSYYDAWRCGIKRDHDPSRPESLVMVALEEYTWLLELVELDDEGAVAAMPSAAHLRGHFDSRRAHADAPVFATAMAE